MTEQFVFEPVGAAAETSRLAALPADGKPCANPALSAERAIPNGHAPVDLLCFHGRPGDLRHEQVLLDRGRRVGVVDPMGQSARPGHRRVLHAANRLASGGRSRGIRRRRLSSQETARSKGQLITARERGLIQSYISRLLSGIRCKTRMEA